MKANLESRPGHVSFLSSLFNIYNSLLEGRQWLVLLLRPSSAASVASRVAILFLHPTPAQLRGATFCDHIFLLYFLFAWAFLVLLICFLLSRRSRSIFFSLSTSPLSGGKQEGLAGSCCSR